MKLTHNIKVVGGGEEAVDCSLAHPDKLLEPSLYQGLLRFKAFSGIRSICIHPNFQYGGLSGPSGYAAEISPTDTFTSNMFRCEKYRIITLAEIDMTADEWTTEFKKEMESRVRRCIPTTAVSPPLLEDESFDGYGFDLSPRGSLIGIIPIKQMNLLDNKLEEHFYIVVDNGPPEETLHKMQEYDETIARKNQTFLEAYGNDIVSSAEHAEKLVTYGEMFYDGSVNDRMLQIQKQRNIRLIIYFAELVGLSLKEQTYAVTNRQDKEVEYRVPDALLDLVSKNAHTPILFEKALAWWPSNAPIMPFSCLPIFPHGMTREQLSQYTDLPIPELSGYPLGAALYEIYKEQPSVFADISKKHNINFHLHVETFSPNIETDYNTYRVDERTGMITWYSNCTSTADGGGVLSFKGLDIGYECLNFDLSTGVGGGSWNNEFLNSYPVVFPFKPEIRKMPQESWDKFFSLTAGGRLSNVPAQWQGRFLNLGATDYVHVQNDLNIPKEPKPFIMNPLKLFLSSDMINIPTFKIHNKS